MIGKERRQQRFPRDKSCVARLTLIKTNTMLSRLLLDGYREYSFSNPLLARPKYLPPATCATMDGRPFDDESVNPRTMRKQKSLFVLTANSNTPAPGERSQAN